jgi:hypothetical protein
MTLFQAIRILAETHTRDDGVTGFVVMAGVGPHDYGNPHPVDRYMEAWQVVREQAYMQVAPQEDTSKEKSAVRGD